MENSPSSSDSNVFSVRIVSIDYYMSSPIPGIDLCYSSFQGGKVNEVPVIRIYGSTPAGQKTCLHVHRALPYLYVPCSDISHQLGQSGEACAQAISLALEKALKLKGSAGSKRQHVHGFSLVWARRFYGYDPSEELYVKLYLYYPQDVSRAANLLLGGSVLEKSLQPHESHIPFLLQFLVDYNLYGMGHLHVSKVKFRPPVPSFFMKKKANYYAQHKQNTDESSMGTNFQADSCSDGCLGSPVWISSTIPDGWIWHSTSDDQDFCPAKRQSACDLEGDAAIDDILNQQCKLYLSLSQTLSNVRMVQSLIPIWEEFERTGTHVETVPPDPGKPHPEDVLVTLSNGLEYANKLMELCDADNSIPCTLVKNGRMSLQSLKSEGDGKDAVGTSQAYSETGSSKRLQSSNDRIGPIFTQDSECQGAGKPCEERDESPVKLSNDELQSLEANLPHCLKVADPEALRLLKWLASSQAAEDINSDDELTRETILSPLIPAITINKMLEKADMDFECASQQECQDILDSVEDIIGVEGKNKRSSQTQPLDCTYQLSSKKAIKIDGYADDQKLITCTGKTSKIVNRECEKPLKLRMQPDCGSSISRKHKRKGSLWSSLPFSSSENMNDGLPANMKAGTCDRETNDCNGTCLLAAEDASGCRNVVMDGAKNNIRSTKVTNTIVGCSVRDLMRRKRRHRSEPTGVENHHDGNITPEEESDSYSFSSKSSDEQDIRPPTSSNSRSRFIGESENIDEDLNVENSVGEACGKAFNVKHKASFCSTYGKLPLSTRREPLSTSNGCGQGRDDMVVERAASGSSNLKVTDFTAGHGGIRSFPYFTNFENQNSSPQLNHEKSFQMDSNDVLTLDGNQRLPWTGKQLQRDAAISSALITCSSESEMVQKNTYDSDIGFKRKTPSGVLGTSSVNFEDMEIMNGAILMQSGYGHNDTDGRDPSLIPCNPSTVVNSVESTAFRFCKKPLVIELTYGLSATVTPGCCSSADGDKVGNKDGDDCPPFFEGDYQELQHTQSKTDELIHHRKQDMGVPSHYQNDGSCLYMLTPSLLPPSLEVVNGWLLRDGTVADVLTEDITVPIAECSSLKESISNQADSQEASAGEHNEAFVESGPTFSAETNMDHVNKQDQGSHFIRLQPLDTGVATVHQTGGNTSQTKQHGVVSQDISQISGPDGKSKLTPLSQAGFRDPASVGAGQQLTLFSIEVQAESRGDLRPDPRFDAISFIALIIQEDDQSIIDCYVLLQGVMVTERRNLDGISDCKLLFCSEEKHLFNEFIKIICNYDPDILMGWDIQGGSLGFLAERAAHLGIGLLNKISRTPSQPVATARDSDIPDTGMVSEVVPEALITDSSRQNDAIIEDEWGRTHASGVHVGGRIVLNIWRLVRSEVRLNFYTAEAVAEAVLRRKIPFIQWKTLTKWFASGPGRARHRCIDYVLERAKLNIQIMNQLDMINRTSELARVFGIDFFSVLSRGSQYRVESMLLRLAHTQNYLALSPGSQQVASQPAMECIPLVMEPESGFYTDPVVVLDFQSLYPSMIIAYNLCFSTCLGKVTPAKPNILGVSSYKPNPDILQDLKDEVLLTPNGVMYVPSKVRKGVLPRLLDEILSTRIMVKHAMKKLSPSEKVLHRIYNARQLALKLIANVTYGYTAAGFSGRMPCAELADSIVQCGRRTLENAILLVNTHDKWKAKVIYGDTDSMFVLLPGRSVGEAFQIGNEIASEVSKMNPNPVVLKMEKVYLPCFLLTKKRYFGYSYEKPGQVKPIFDAKGIETVRRDTCGAVSKTMEQSLRLFFEHQDVNEVKSYLLRQWTRILSGRVSLQDFVFAKEVRLGTYSSRTSSLPPAAIVATKAMRADPRAEPRYAERIPYVVVHGEPGARLVDMVVDPLDLLAIDSPFRLNDVYYIKKQIIPALQRVFGLVGVDLNQWFLDMPRPVRESIAKRQSPALNSHRTRIDYYYLSKHCVMCGELVQASAAPLCDLCSRNKAAAAVAVTGRTSNLEREMQHLAAICRHCGGGDWIIESGVKCTSLACSVFYERRKVQKELQSLSTVATESGFYPKCMAEWF